MTREEFQAKWNARLEEWRRLGVVVDGVMIGEEITADFESVMTSHDEAVLNTNQAAAMTGYSRAQLLHLCKQGKLRGYKKGKNVFFRAGDLPRKPRGGRVVTPHRGPTTPTADEETRANARRLAARLSLSQSQRNRET